MKKNIPKFLIAKNEAAKPGATYIVHTQEPQFVGEIYRFDSLSERNAFVESAKDREVIVVTPTTLLVIQSYINTDIKVSDKKYLESKITHWILSNYINNE